MPSSDRTVGSDRAMRGTRGNAPAAAGAADSLVWLAAFRAEHPDVSVHSDNLGVWFADAPAWRVYGRTLAEFLEKLRNRFPLRAAEPDG
jgi:hypothetical protein